MTSLRTRIFAIVAAATVLVWSTAATWTYFNTRADVQRVLDRRLVEAAHMVASMTGNLATGTEAVVTGNALAGTGYERQLACQIWSLEGRLIGRSSHAPDAPMATSLRSGFSERQIGGETWRVYSLVDRTRGMRVTVGDNVSVRQRLVGGVMTGLLIPFAAALAVLSVLIWAAVGRGLAPLAGVTRKLRQREPGELSPLAVAKLGPELSPVIEALNGLLQRLSRLRENERHFIASAAHELQTPLAGLRTHAQVALLAQDTATRDKSLHKIQTSVDRTSRLVHQLLELSREEAIVQRPHPSWVSLRGVVGCVAEELRKALNRGNLQLKCAEEAQHTFIHMDEAALTLAMRNLIENAINHSPDGGTITIAAAERDGAVCIDVADQGPGIRPGELAQIRERFVRGREAAGNGSGLGLSIVELAVGRSGGTLHLSNKVAGGLCATLVLPAGTLRMDRPDKQPADEPPET